MPRLQLMGIGLAVPLSIGRPAPSPSQQGSALPKAGTSRGGRGLAPQAGGFPGLLGFSHGEGVAKRLYSGLSAAFPAGLSPCQGPGARAGTQALRRRCPPLRPCTKPGLPVRDGGRGRQGAGSLAMSPLLQDCLCAHVGVSWQRKCR